MNYFFGGENVFVAFSVIIVVCIYIVYLYQVGHVTLRYSIQMLPSEFLDFCSNSYVTCRKKMIRLSED